MMATVIHEHPSFHAASMLIGGRRETRPRTLDVIDPYTGQRVGTVPMASVDDVRDAIETAYAYRPRLTRYARAQILERAAVLLRERTEAASSLISRESGLSKKDSRYEIGRTRFICPAELDDEVTAKVQALALEAFKLLGCSVFARVKLLG